MLLLLPGCGQTEEGRGSPAPERSDVTLAVAEQPISAPVFVAASRRFFRDEGLTVELVSRPTGETALQEVIEGRAHFATTAETPVVHAALDGDSVAILGTVASTRRGLAVLARDDRGITSPDDLKGRRVGATLGTNTEFFLDLFLTLHGLSRDSVEVVHVSADGLVPALMGEEVDALVAWEPHRTELRKRLGPDLRVFLAPEIYTWFWNVVADGDFVDAHPRTAEAVLRALRRAEGVIVDDPAGSRTVVAERLNLGMEALKSVWATTRFIVSLDQALIVSMEDQAMWLQDRGSASSTEVPNFLRFVRPGPLSRVAPEAVTILGRDVVQ